MALTRHGIFLCGIVALSAILSACTQSEADSVDGVNSGPTISGTPGTSVAEDTAYSFKPTAADSNNDPLIFGIDAKPVWAMFNTSTGEVSGTPTAADVGVYPGIVVWVSDGESGEIGSIAQPRKASGAQTHPQILLRRPFYSAAYRLVLL